LKQCTKCKEQKSLDEFRLRKDNRNSWCKPCEKAYKKEWDTKRSNELKDFLFEYLSANQCVSCGTKDILVLEFDHKEPKEKSFNIGKAVGGKERLINLEQLIAEVAKCDVMCRNCHQRKTHRDNNSWKYLRVAKENVVA